MKLLVLIPLIFTLTNLPYKQSFIKSELCEQVNYMMAQRETGYKNCMGEKRTGIIYSCKNPFPGASDGYYVDSITPSVVFYMGSFNEYHQARNHYQNYIKQIDQCLGNEYKLHKHYHSTHPDILISKFRKKPNREVAIMVKLQKVVNSMKDDGIQYDVYLIFESAVNPAHPVSPSIESKP